VAADNTKVIATATASPLMKHDWTDRGRAPAGYTKGMAAAFADVYRELKAADPVAVAATEPPAGAPAKDVLDWYDAALSAAGVGRGSTPEDRLIQIFSILIGLGMRESSGQHCEGRDMSAANSDADTAEAGLFQVSHNSIAAHALLPGLSAAYRGRTDLLDVFKEGVRCKASALKNWGSGAGRDFQELTKQCPAFAVRYAALLLRVSRKHWGPINTRKAEILPAAGKLFRDIKALVDAE
jgi:hypothetical protein